MYSRQGNYKRWTNYSNKQQPKEEASFYEFQSMEDKTEKIRQVQGKLVVVDIYATWCGPCKEIAPMLNRLAEKYKNNVVFFKENVESELCPPGSVTAVPTFHFFYNGTYIENSNVTGADMSELEKTINVLLDKTINSKKEI